MRNQFFTPFSFFDDFLEAVPVRSWRALEKDWQPACEVEEAEDHYLLELEMPGVPKDQIKIEVANNQLAITGERKLETRKEELGAYYSERKFGRFYRIFALPVGVNGDKIEASYEDGILSVYVPKPQSAVPRQIKVSSGASSGFFGKLIGQGSKKEETEKAAS